MNVHLDISQNTDNLHISLTHDLVNSLAKLLYLLVQKGLHTVIFINL